VLLSVEPIQGLQLIWGAPQPFNGHSCCFA
jgi:hypothetical protein